MRASDAIHEIARSVAQEERDGWVMVRQEDLVHGLLVYIDELEERVRRLEAKESETR
jgi:hypothetical protein